jgi:hypothetical protein
MRCLRAFLRETVGPVGFVALVIVPTWWAARRGNSFYWPRGFGR